MEQQILDDLREDFPELLRRRQKTFRILEGVLRLIFFVITTLLWIVTTKNQLQHTTEIPEMVGIIIAMLIFEFLVINHLIQGIRCVALKEYKTALVFPIASLLGLFFIAITILVGAFQNALGARWAEIVVYALFETYVIYLIVKEFQLMKRRVRKKDKKLQV